ncbi:MAG: hypothetical protein J1E57_00655 [Prevotella sp.]|nr:hypothetical protein [Prevotella sp.]
MGRFHRAATLPPSRINVYAEVVYARSFRELWGKWRQQCDEAFLYNLIGGDSFSVYCCCFR